MGVAGFARQDEDMIAAPRLSRSGPEHPRQQYGNADCLDGYRSPDRETTHEERL
jgi:hypothetical protein